MSKRLRPNEASVTLPVVMPLSMYRALKSQSTRTYSCGEMVRAAVAAWLSKKTAEGRAA